MTPPIPIKPHHFVDIATSVGAGQTEFAPHPYGHAVHTVAEAILCDPDIAVRMELGADAICAPCSHNVDGRCYDVIDTSYRPDAPESKQEWNLRIDRRWCRRLCIAQGDTLSARALCLLIRDRMGDITDVYREIPAEMTEERAAKLTRGIALMLGDEPGTPRRRGPSAWAS